MVSMSTTPKPLDATAAAAAVSGDGGGGGGGGGKEKEKQVGAVAAPLQPPMAVPAPVAGEEARKVRKPYTITKSRESWTEPEHDKFLEALQLFDRDWKKIEAYVGSKTVIQIRSHAQKYFLKVQKNGTGEHLPPPRPKRKAAHPYPQKASKNARAVSQAAISQPPPLGEQDCVMSMDTSPVIRNVNASAAVPSWDNAIAQPFSASRTQGAVATNNCSSSIESPSATWPTSEAVEQENVLRPLRAMPDFAQVYSFLGSIFDPDTSGHLQKLKAMDPIDVETVLLLMRNLSMNLTNPDFEAHLRLLSSCNSGSDQIKSEGMENLGSLQSCHLPFMVTSE
ncbi:protein REVEILLE 6-like isoform X2 [Oryza brachyantha]|uniref:protein REVEILLE 6-like isoform X2 n=1 Tax=Oryza brachyantha TaxID=4533 RepID=UPI000776283C|nr:protein REVEILLE 6-like isoform X2 [Oryza brachyantha]